MACKSLYDPAPHFLPATFLSPLPSNTTILYPSCPPCYFLESVANMCHCIMASAHPSVRILFTHAQFNSQRKSSLTIIFKLMLSAFFTLFLASFCFPLRPLPDNRLYIHCLLSILFTCTKHWGCVLLPAVLLAHG